MIIFIGKGTGREAALVPWKELAEDRHKFVDEEYWPQSCRMTDPSHLQAADVQRLLVLWHDRQTARQPTFRFNQVKDLDGNLVPPGTQTKIPKMKKRKQQVIVSSDEEEEEEEKVKRIQVHEGKRKRPATPSSSEGEEFDFSQIVSSPTSEIDDTQRKERKGPPVKKPRKDLKINLASRTAKEDDETNHAGLTAACKKPAKSNPDKEVKNPGRAAMGKSGRPYVEISKFWFNVWVVFAETFL